MKNKKLALYFICLIMAACLSACGVTSETDSGQSTPVETARHFNVAVFYYDYSDAYISAVRTALNKDLTDLGIPYTEYDAASNQPSQTSQIEDALMHGASMLLVNIVSSGSTDIADSICLRAYASHIPVVFFNRSVEAEGDEGVILDFYSNVAFVGTDPAEAGHLQGQMIGNYLIENYEECDLNKDGVISYASFKGEAKNAEAIYRTLYSAADTNSILRSNGKPALSYFNPSSVDEFQLDLTGKWSMDAVRDYMMTNLGQYNETSNNMIELIICNSDTMAEGAIRALQAFGYNTGDEEATTIPVFGVDASPAGRQLISEGKMAGTVVQDAQGMADCISLLTSNISEGRNLLDGTEGYARDTKNHIEHKLYIPYSVYEPEK